MSRPPDEQLSLSNCPSPPHRAVAGLLRPAMGMTPPDGLGNDLRDSAPEDIARVAQLHHVHVAMALGLREAPALADVLPEDLRIFFTEMYLANRARNAALCAQIEKIGEAFAARGIVAVILKGGAELLSPAYQDPALRFISDTDLLVQSESIDHAARVLRELGGVMEPDEGRPSHQLPSITLDETLGPIELHHRIGDGKSDRVLAPGDVFADAEVHECGLLVPAPAKRLTHMIVHAQIHHHQYALTTLSLRDCMDMASMRRSFPESAWRDTRAAFARAGQEAACDAFEAVAEAIVPVQPPSKHPRRAQRWAARALDHFGRPETQRRRESIGWLLLCLWRFASSAGFRRYYWGLIVDRGRLASKLRALVARPGKFR